MNLNLENFVLGPIIVTGIKSPVYYESTLMRYFFLCMITNLSRIQQLHQKVGIVFSNFSCIFVHPDLICFHSRLTIVFLYLTIQLFVENVERR